MKSSWFRLEFFPLPALLAGVFLIGTAAEVVAQGLRLNDVLSTTTVEQSDVATTTSSIGIADLEADIRNENWERAARRGSDLLEQLDNDAANYTHILILRAQALEKLGDSGEVSRLAEEYLSLTPDGPNSLIAHRMLSHHYAMNADFEKAAEHFRAIFESESPEEYLKAAALIEAAEVWVQQMEAKTAQQALGLIEEDNLSTSEQALYMYWYLESLLIEDVPNLDIAPPAKDTPLAPAIQFRRALLFDLRGERDAARKLYRSLDLNQLSHSEQALLERRLTGQ